MEPIHERTPILTQDTKVNKMCIDYATFYYGDATSLSKKTKNKKHYCTFVFLFTVVIHNCICRNILFRIK